MSPVVATQDGGPTRHLRGYRQPHPHVNALGVAIGVGGLEAERDAGPRQLDAPAEVVGVELWPAASGITATDIAWL